MIGHSLIRSRVLATRACLRTASSYSTTNGNTPKCTTSYALFEGLWEAGVTTCFVNVGSDHPSILEALVRGKRERPDMWPRTITCPSEITAISMADGYVRVTGKPAAVLVHVDVGTQALGQGVHNASVGRAPMLIFAGLCPYTESGELEGSRTEYMHWLQEAPQDQSAIVRQYMRYTGEVRTGLNVKQMIGRALQFASSAPRGPTYLSCARETLAQQIPQTKLNQDQWVPVGPAALPGDAVEMVTSALVNASNPLIITGYSGRDRRTPELLVQLADCIPTLRVHDTGGSDMSFPFSHPASEGFRLATHDCTKDADVILLLDCDVPWLPSLNAPVSPDTKIYHIDCDPLNQQMPVSFFPANGRWKVDSFLALGQLLNHIQSNAVLQSTLKDEKFTQAYKQRVARHAERLKEIASLPVLADSQPLDANNIGSLLKSCLPDSTTFVVEAVTAGQLLYDQIQPSRPGSWINCGGTGIGWSNGAALGVKMGIEELQQPHYQQQKQLTVEASDFEKPSLVCQIVGDGSFMCAAPSSALWVASKYKIPILSIVLNNGGWKAPRHSAQIVYPSGFTKSATDEEINTSFNPSPNYAKLAEAAAGSTGWMNGIQVQSVQQLRNALQDATERLTIGGKGMLIEALL